MALGFLLFVDDGLLHFLEGFTFDEPWPGDLKLIWLYYLRPQEPSSGAMIETAQRDLSFLDAQE
jgi:hypothetical protein